MTTGIKANGIDLATIFGPKGTHTAATTGIKSNGTDLNQLLLALADGMAVAATGIKVNGVDLNTIFGASSSTLPIQGQIFTAVPTSAGTTSAANLFFSTNNSTWSVYDPNNGGSGVPLASGSIPSGAAKVQFSDALTSGTTANILINQASSVTSLTSTQIYIEIGNSLVGGGQAALKSTYQVQVQYQNSAGSVISTTTFTFVTNTNHT